MDTHSGEAVFKNISEATKKIAPSQSTAFPRHQNKGGGGVRNT